MASGRVPKTSITFFIRKVIICEPPFEAVQLNIHYLKTDKRIAGTRVELAAYRKALYVKRPSKKGTFIRVLIATVIASRSSGPISYTGLVSQKKTVLRIICASGQHIRTQVHSKRPDSSRHGTQ